MSQQIVDQVNRAHPQLLQTNVGATCFEFVSHVVAALKAEGHTAALMCKTAGEGQYTPPGFVPFDAVGLDGKTYRITGFSHDSIWSDGAQYDTIARGNDGAEQLHNPDGSVLTGLPTWNAIPQQVWRPNNPPFAGAGSGAQPPVIPPAAQTFPYPDENTFWSLYTHEVKRRYPGGVLNDEAFRWFSRCGFSCHEMKKEDAAAKHLAELDAITGGPK